ncbi:hypothetical protein ACHAXT_010311 [Thalassiosira profunda]
MLSKLLVSSRSRQLLRLKFTYCRRLSTKMGQGVDVIDGVIRNVNPATGELIEPPVAATTPSELAAAVATANAAQEKWSALPLAERIDLLRKGLGAVESIAEELASTITKEMGKVSAEAKLEVKEAVGLKGDWLDLVKEANEDVVLGDGEAQSVIVRDPLGVVAVISPWNFPAGEIPFLAVPALAAGNAVIVKPSEVTPLTGQMYCSALASELPEGVLQCVQGAGEVGELLTSSEDVQMIAMTGSTGTGKRIMEKCSKSLKRLVLELGGKDPMVVFADADLDKAARDAVNNSLFNAGQVCCSVERIYVEESAKNEFEQKVVELAKKQKVGVPTEKGVTLGPMVSEMQMEIVKKQVDDSLDNGAKLLYRSDIPESGGNWYPVTVVSDLKQDMNIQANETFGPVVAVSTFDGSEDEAARLANETEYGLASYVYTGDLKKGARVARRIRSGQVGINCYSLVAAQPKCPWVGHKMSGYGAHSGMDGFRSFSEQSLRRAEGNDDEATEDLGLLLSSLECLEDDYGSYAPVVPSTSNASKQEQPKASVTLLDVKNGASDSMGVEAELTPSDFLKLGPNMVFEVTQSLGGRLLDSPTLRGRSFSCTSDAATEVWSNLTGKVAANEDGSGITEIEVLLNNREALACTFAGKEETCLGDDESNTLCGIDDSYKDDKEFNAETKPKVLVRVLAEKGE